MRGQMTHAGTPGPPLTGWARAGLAVAWSARLALALLVVSALSVGDWTALARATVFAAFSLAIWRIAPPLLDAGLAAVLAAHGWGAFLGREDIDTWWPAVHVVAPLLIALILAAAAADGRLGRPRPPRAAAAAALVGGLVVILAWEGLEALLTRLPGVDVTDDGGALADLALGAAAVAGGAVLAAVVLRLRRPRPGAPLPGSPGPRPAG
jgi:hypothetical protein